MTKKNILPILLVIVLALMSTAAAHADGCGYYNYGNCCSPYYPYQPAQPIVRDCAAFVTDVTIPDGSYVTPGSTIVKTWRIRNTGSTTWDGNYKLVFVSGNQMGVPYSAALPYIVYPGQTVDISVTMFVPTESGSYKGEWMLENASGSRFGVGTTCSTPIWVSLVNYYQQPTYPNNNCRGNCCGNCWNNCPHWGVPGFDHDGDYNPVPRPQPWSDDQQPQLGPFYPLY